MRENQDKSTGQTLHGSAYPKEISQQCTPATHRSSALPECPLGVFHSSLWPIKAPGYLGGSQQASHHPSDASIPPIGRKRCLSTTLWTPSCNGSDTSIQKLWQIREHLSEDVLLLPTGDSRTWTQNSLSLHFNGHFPGGPGLAGTTMPPF